MLSTGAIANNTHFDAKGNSPSSHTVKWWEDVKDKMAFEDQRDFEEQQKGFISAPEYTEIMAAAGHVTWSMGQYTFLLEDKEYKSFHPSLQRQASAESNLIAI